MKINENVGKPIKAQQPDGSTPTVRIMFETYRVEKDEDTQKLIDVFAEGVEIVMALPAGDCSYVIIKKVKTVNIAL